MRLVGTSAFGDSGSGLVCQMPAGLDNPYYAKTGRAMRYVGREVGATHDFSQTNSFSLLDGPAKYRSLESYQFDSGRIGCQILAPTVPNRHRCGI